MKEGCLTVIAIYRGGCCSGGREEVTGHRDNDMHVLVSMGDFLTKYGIGILYVDKGKICLSSNIFLR